MEALHRVGFDTFERTSYNDDGYLILPDARKQGDDEG